MPRGIPNVKRAGAPVKRVPKEKPPVPNISQAQADALAKSRIQDGIYKLDQPQLAPNRDGAKGGIAPPIVELTREGAEAAQAPPASDTPPNAPEAATGEISPTPAHLTRMTHPTDPNASADGFERDESGAFLVPHLQIADMQRHGFVVDHLPQEPIEEADGG